MDHLLLLVQKVDSILVNRRANHRWLMHMILLQLKFIKPLQLLVLLGKDQILL